MGGLEKKPPRLVRIPDDDDDDDSSSSSSSSSWLRLSPIDIFMPSFHFPVLLAFPRVSQGFVARLEGALREVLGCRYRELAGRLQVVETLGIRLNNQGVLWLEAAAEESLEEFVKLGPHERLHQLTPMSSHSTTPLNILAIPLLLQVTRFSCGGATLGFGVHHQVVDANSFPQFLFHLAAATRGIPSPLATSDRSCLMPRNPPTPQFDHPEYTSAPNLVSLLTPQQSQSVTTSRFHFSPTQLALLKAQCNNNNDNKQPRFSTFVSLAAHLWKLVTMARQVNGGGHSILLCPVNGRRVLSLGDEYFGNAVFRDTTVASVEEVVGKPLSYLASLIQAGFDKVMNAEYMRSIVDVVAIQQQQQQQQQRLPATADVSFAPNLVITSWARAPLYEIDFGLGKPVLATPTNGPCEGYIRIAPSAPAAGGLDVIATLHLHCLQRLASLILESNK